MRSEEDRRIKQYRGTWCVVWRENGQTKRHSLRTDDRAQADRNYQEYVRQLQNTGETVNDVLNRWFEEKKELSSIETARQRSHNIRNHFGNYFPDQISRELCRQYRELRKVSNTTIKNELAILRCAVRWNDPNTKAIIEMPPSAPPRDIRITKDEYKYLLECATSHHIKLFIILAGGTAARVTALLELTWDRVNFERGQINLTTGDHKNKRRALIPMTNTVKTALLQAYDARTSDNVIEFGGMAIKSIRKGFKQTAVKAGLPKISPHVLRHSAATWMAEAGIPMAEIAQYLGHSNPNITYKVYARYSPEYLRGAADALEF